MQMTKGWISLVLAALLSTVSVAAFAAGGSLKLTHDVYSEVEKKDEAGHWGKVRVFTHKAVPGDTVLYVTTVENVGKKSVDAGAAVTAPVSEHTEYQADSAFGANTEMRFSIDGGKSYASPDKLTIKTSDGAVLRAPATAYTNIQWIFKSQFAPGATGEVGFRAIIK